MLNKKEAVEQTHQMLEWRKVEKPRLDKIHAYWRGKQKLPVVPSAVPVEVRRMAEMSRVNIVGLIISNVAQSLFVNGYRQDREADDAPPWQVWQANRMDARQSAVHRAAAAYGVAYTTVLPGDVAPVLKAYSPRRMTTMYGEDEDWPIWAMAARPSGKQWLYRLFDDEATYYCAGGPSDGDRIEFIDSNVHELGVCPTVRFLNQHDTDDELLGEVEPIMAIQDQIDLTTFELLVAQHFAAFRQRWAIGWVAESEEQRLKASSSRLWTFDENPDEMKLGEFEQTDISGYIESREASLRHGAAISQTPAHELIGQLVNLSAEALVAAEKSQQRKLSEIKRAFGESWEQDLALAGRIAGYPVSDGAQVRWEDTEGRSFAAVVDALGKLAQMLGVPVQELWERVPGVTQQDVDRWKAAAGENDPLASLGSLLDQQMAGPEDAEEIKKKADAMGVLIRSGVDADDAAARVGLRGIKFTGAVPVSLRLPEDDASALEST